MASKTHIHAVAPSVGQYVLVAILVGALAFLGVLFHQDSFTVTILIGAVMAALTAGFASYAGTGNIPGTQIPIHTLLVWGIAALLGALEFVFGQTAYTPETFIAAGIVFATYLLNEVQGGNPNPVPVPPAPSTP